MSDSITISLENYRKLRKLYKNARRDGVSVVKFGKAELVVDYLHYVLEYMEQGVIGVDVQRWLKHNKLKRIGYHD